MPATPHGIGTGGPGGKPTAAAPTAGQWQFALPVNPAVELNEHAGSGVHVLILDSFRNNGDLNSGRTKHTNHPLLTGLLAPNRLNLQPGRPADLQLPPHTGAGDLRYRMADHGLFAAGIVHSMVPEATLHLVEVLNSYGVGSFESVAKGLLHALAVRHKHGEARLIVNCSFMLSAPEPLPDKSHTHSDYATELDDPSIFTYMNKPFSDIIATLIRQGIVIVAAAGNDAEPGAARPAVRYPAAFDGVISVGALPRSGLLTNWVHATYSNASGRVGKEGYLTLGGEPGTDNGVLGIYLDNFPEPLHADHRQLPEHEDAHTYSSANANGWGWWAGTSFATPIVAGCMAALPAPAVPANSAAMVHALEAALKQLTRLTPGVAPILHNVLYVTQGL